MIALQFLLFAIITATASALHGGGVLSKAKVVALHSFVSLLCGWFAPIGVVAYWAFFRRGPQAKAELDYLSGFVAIDAVRKVYPLRIGHVIAPIIEWATHLNPYFGLNARRRQEAVGGFVLGLLISILFVLLPGVYL